MQTNRLKEGGESMNTCILKILCTQCRFVAVRREGENTDGAQFSLDRPSFIAVTLYYLVH